MPVLPRLFASRIATTIAEDDPSRPLWRHPARIAAAVLALTLAAVPLLPDDGHDREEIAPSSETTPAPGASGRGEVTPQMQAEIDRVVAAGRSCRPLCRTWGDQGRHGARRAARCAAPTFDGQRYCLGVGWTEDTEADVRARVASAARVAARTTGRDGHRRPRRHRRPGPYGADGAEGPRRADRARAAPRAARSVAKVWLLRHEILGVAAARRTSSSGTRRRAPTSPTTADRQGPRRLPRHVQILDLAALRADPYLLVRPDHHADDRVGLAARAKPQRYWAKRLSTTSSGTAITDMVRVVNDCTGYDKRKYAGHLHRARHLRTGPYKQWMLLQMRHIEDYQAPGRAAPGPAQAVLPLPRRRRVRSLPGRSRLRQERQEADPDRLLRAAGTSSASTRRSPSSTACSGATPTTASAPTGPTSSTTRSLMRARCVAVAGAAVVPLTACTSTRGRTTPRLHPESSAPGSTAGTAAPPQPGEAARGADLDEPCCRGRR